MPATVRKRLKGEKGKPWKIIGPTGKIEGESDTKAKAEISAGIRTQVHERKLKRGRR